MVKRFRCCRRDSNSVWIRLPCCLLKSPQKHDFADIHVITFFEVRNFGMKSPMTVTFFWKCSKFNVDIRNVEKNSEKVFCFEDNSIWIGSVNFCLLTRKYLSSAHNVLTNSLKILHSTKIDFFQLNYVPSDQ